MRRLLLAALLVLVPTLATAQQPDSMATDTIFLRAQRLVAEGQGDAGRALVQQQLDSATPGTARYAEALYWHAVVAATAADAERDLRAIVVNYPLSKHAADALLRLAQLEMTRGDDDQALAHLNRILLEHPDNPDRSRADFWMARVLFDKSDAPKACARLGDAIRTAPSGDVELRNQIDYLNQRCAGVDTAAVAATPAAKQPADKGKTSPAKGKAPPAKGKAVAATSKSATTHTASKAAAAAHQPARAATGHPAPRSTASAHTGRYTVQVAAYSTRAAAEVLQKSLRQRGYDARVVGRTKPFRVRVGFYATRAEADAEVRRMKARHMTAFVTEAEPR